MQVPWGWLNGAEDTRRQSTLFSSNAGRLVAVAESDSMTDADACEITYGHD